MRYTTSSDTSQEVARHVAVQPPCVAAAQLVLQVVHVGVTGKRLPAYVLACDDAAQCSTCIALACGHASLAVGVPSRQLVV